MKVEFNSMHDISFSIVALAQKLSSCDHSFLGVLEEGVIKIKASSNQISQKKINNDDPLLKLIKETSKFTEVKDLPENEHLRSSEFLKEIDEIKYLGVFPVKKLSLEIHGFIVVIGRKTPPENLSIADNLALLLPQAEEHLKQLAGDLEDQILSKALTLSNDLITVIKFDGKFKKLNKAVKTLLGYNENELSGKHITDYIHPDDAESTMNQINKLINGESAAKFSHRLKDHSGEYKKFAWRATGDLNSKWIFAIGRDISEEKENEDRLLASEEKFRSFFENSQGLMLTHDMEGNFLSFNNYGARLLGHTVEEMLNKKLWDIVPEKFHEEINDYFSEIKRDGKAQGLMTTYQANGRFKVWLYSNTMEKDHYGNSFVIGNSVDITERLRLEKSIRNAKELLNQTHAMAKIGGWKYDLEKEFISWTEITRTIFGVSDNFVPDLKNGVDFYKEGYDRDKIKELIDLAINYGTPWDERLKIINENGKEIWIRTLGEARIENGKCYYLFGTIQDIDDVVKRENQLIQKEQMLLAISQATDELLSNRKLFEAISNSLEIIGKSVKVDRVYYFENNLGEKGEKLTSQRYEWSNDTVEPQINNPDLQNIPFEAFGEFVSPMEKNEIFQAIISKLPENSDTRKFLENQSIKSVLTIPIFTKKGYWGFIGYDDCTREREWSHAELSLLKSFSNSISNAIDRNILESKLIESKDVAEKASLAKSEFLANMSHEIRTPLNGIIGFTDLLLKTELNEGQNQYIDIVNQSANTLLNIINDILDFSKIEAGKLELELVKSDVFELAGQATDVVSFQAQKNGVEMLLNIEKTLPRFIFVDEIRLKQILINLLGNAVKFTKAGEIELKIKTLELIEKNKRVFRFEVRDTGIGISEEYQKRIFDAFSQEDGSTTKKYGGTGLGLSISNKLLSMMGSELQLTSQLNKGSTFYFDIMLTTEEGETSKKQEANIIKKVLVVDDNKNNRQILKETLSLKNIQVEEAQNGFDALQFIENNDHFDAVLMDLNMPYMDGLETIKKIRENFTNEKAAIPIMLLHSSSEDDYIHKKCKELSVKSQLVKPIKNKDLFEALSRLNPSTVKTNDAPAAEIDENNYNSELKILIAEDNTINMFLAKTIVMKVSPEVQIIEATDGLAAYEMAVKHLPDIILMDIQMPVMSGHEATRKIKEDASTKTIPIVAITAGNVKGEREKCMESGMVDFVPKPIVEKNIRDIFDTWLKNDEPKKEEEKLEAGEKDPSLNNNSISNKKHFDVDKVKEYLGNEPEIIKEVLKLTIQELDHSEKILRDHFSNKNLEGLSTEGHKLKGSALTAGLDKIFQLALTLEEMKTFDIEETKKILDGFYKENKYVKELINDYIANGK